MYAEAKIRNAPQAIEAALAYLQEQTGQSLPVAGSRWQEKTLYTAGVEDLAITSKLLLSGDWTIEVYQGAAPISLTVYQVTVFNPVWGFYWKGSIKADGSIRDDAPLRTLSAEESQEATDELARKIHVPPPRLGGYGH
jgi:hypothetical protein